MIPLPHKIAFDRSQPSTHCRHSTSNNMLLGNWHGGMKMRKLAVAVAYAAILSGCASLPAGRQTDDPRVAAEEIKVLEERWTTAANNRDTRFMAQFLAPEFTLASVDGPQGANFTRREDWMRVWLGPNHLPYEAKVINVVVAGNTAVATLEARWRRKSFLTDTWARRNGRWQLMFRHSAPRP